MSCDIFVYVDSESERDSDLDHRCAVRSSLSANWARPCSDNNGTGHYGPITCWREGSGSHAGGKVGILKRSLQMASHRGLDSYVVTRARQIL